MEFLNLAREPKLTILGDKLFRTFTTRSLKKFFRLFDFICVICSLFLSFCVFMLCFMLLWIMSLIHLDVLYVALSTRLCVSHTHGTGDQDGP